MEAKPSRERRSALRGHSSVVPFVKTPTPRKASKSDKPPSLPVLVAGREVLGRELSVFKSCKKESIWLPGRVKDFDEPQVLHQIAYNLPLPEVVKEDEVKPTEWVCLSKNHFAWTNSSDVCTFANPTFSPRFTPQKEKAIGQRVKVFWSTMSKWYQGKVVDYDTSTGMHQVKFADGESKPYRLSQEATVWLDIPELSSGAAIKQTRAEEGDQIPSGVICNNENNPPLKQKQGMSNSSMSVRKKARKEKDDAPVTRKITRRQHAQSAAKANGVIVQKIEDIKEAKAPAVSSNTKTPEVSVASKVVIEPSKQLATPIGVPKDPAPKLEEHTVHTGDACLSELAKAHSNDAKSASSSSEQFQKPADEQTTAWKQNGKFGFDVKVHCSEQDPAQGARTLLKSPAMSRKRLRQGSVTLAGSPKACEDAPASKLLKTQKGPSKVLPKSRPAQRSKQGSRLCKNSADLQFVEWCEAIKGCRVGVWWPSDNCYYKGEVKGYDSCHRTLRVEYDDGITERTDRIEDCKFTWLTPRGISAGATDKLHTAFQNLGAVNATSPVRPSEERLSVAVEIPVKMESPDRTDTNLHPSRPRIELSDPSCLPSAPSPPSAAITQQSSQTTMPGLTSQLAINGFNFASIVTKQESLPPPSILGPNNTSAPSQSNGLKPAVDIHGVLQAASARLPQQAPVSQSVDCKALSQASSRPASLHCATQTSPSLSPPARSPAAGAATYRKPPQKTSLQADNTQRPKADQAVGWIVSMPFRGDGCVYEGRIISYTAGNGKHRILWQDGEDEWVTLASEDLTWLRNNKKVPGYMAGLPGGATQCSADDLVGCQVGVYWDGEKKFFEGRVRCIADEALNEHSVDYTDGENKIENLSEMVVKIILPANVSSDRTFFAYNDRGRTYEDSDVDTKPRTRRKGRNNASDDSDGGSYNSECPPDRSSYRSIKTFAPVPKLSRMQTIRRMASGRGSLLQFLGEDAPTSPVHSPISPQGSMAFKMDGKGPPACVRTVSGLKTAEGFRAGVKRVRVFLTEPDLPSHPLKSQNAASLPDDKPLLPSKKIANTQFQPIMAPTTCMPATLKKMMERVELATKNIRNGMPLEPPFNPLVSMPSSRPSCVPEDNSTPTAILTSAPTHDASAPKVNVDNGESSERKEQNYSILLAVSPPPPPPAESLTPPPSPFSGIKESSVAPSCLPVNGPQALLGTLRTECEDEDRQVSMSLPQTPSAKFEKGVSRAGSIISAMKGSEDGCRPSLDVHQAPEILESH